MKAFIIEPNPYKAIGLEVWLTKLGFQVRTFANSISAYKCLRTEKCDEGSNTPLPPVVTGQEIIRTFHGKGINDINALDPGTPDHLAVDSCIQLGSRLICSFNDVSRQSQRHTSVK